MSLLYTAIILFLVVLAIFLGQTAMQFIRIERKVEETVETLEEELIDVFGMQPLANVEAKKPPPKPAKPSQAKPGKKA